MGYSKPKPRETANRPGYTESGVAFDTDPLPGARRDRSRAAFTSFLERDAMRERRRRSRRRTLVVSVLVHVVALGTLVFLSFWQVDELWSPSVEVKMFSPAALPPGVSARP